MLQEWTIQARADRCAITEKAFTDGQSFLTLLHRDKHGALVRRDVSEEGWSQLQGERGNKPPFSQWRSKFTLPPPPAPETIPRTDAEALLRRFLTGGLPEERRAAYILALMLERKRLLKPTGTAEEGGQRLLIYEHAKTGETFVVIDPALRLDRVEEVQKEVSALLAAAVAPSAPAATVSISETALEPTSKEKVPEAVSPTG